MKWKAKLKEILSLEPGRAEQSQRLGTHSQKAASTIQKVFLPLSLNLSVSGVTQKRFIFPTILLQIIAWSHKNHFVSALYYVLVS